MPYEDDENLAFDVANLNKKFITLNLKLLSEADVFVTSTRTKSLKKLGLDYETLKEKFPSLIFAQVLGYGEYGPEKDNAGFSSLGMPEYKNYGSQGAQTVEIMSKPY